MISFIMCTYNRAATIKRAIESVLTLTDADWELIIVDDGSTDNTKEIVAGYLTDPRIRLVSHPANRGVTAAKNTGLDHIRGDWFTTLDSDDEVLPQALDRFKAVMALDPKITAIECNCIDTTTGSFSGRGLDRDRYLTLEQMVSHCTGEFWGVTRTSLLEGMRFNEKIPGMESILWYRISEKATRYYLHEALRLYHTEGHDRISAAKPFEVKKDLEFYLELEKETHYLELVERWNPKSYSRLLFKIGFAKILFSPKSDVFPIIKKLVPYYLPGAVFLFMAKMIGPRRSEKLIERLELLRGK